MYEQIIKNYIKNLTKEDVYNYALKNNIVLNKHEVNILYNTIKSKWLDILKGNIKDIWQELSHDIQINNLLAIKELYCKYKEKLEQ